MRVHILTPKQLFDARKKLNRGPDSAGNFIVGELMKALFTTPYEIRRNKAMSQVSMEARSRGLFLCIVSVGPLRQSHTIGYDANNYCYIDQSSKSPIAPKDALQAVYINEFSRFYEVVTYDPNECIRSKRRVHTKRK